MRQMLSVDSTGSNARCKFRGINGGKYKLYYVNKYGVRDLKRLYITDRYGERVKTYTKREIKEYEKGLKSSGGIQE